MKQSHTQTPRTLADCDFTVGYPVADLDRRGGLLETVAGVIVTVAVVAMVVLTLVHWAAAE